jgi:hypothetical protein
MTISPRVAAVVLAARDDASVGAALERVAWAAKRVVLDPTGRLGRGLPAGVRRVTGAIAPSDLAGADWALLLADDERVTPAFAAALVAEIARPDAVACTVSRAVAVGDARLRVPGAAVRLVPAGEARLADPRRGVLAWQAPRGRCRRLAEPLVVCEAASLSGAVGELDAETTALAALAGMAVRVGWRNALVEPLAAAGRLLVARGARLGWGRWVRAVLAGYRVLVLQAKCWERARERPL